MRKSRLARPSAPVADDEKCSDFKVVDDQLVLINDDQAEGDDQPRRFAARRSSAMPGGILVDAVSPPIPCVIRNTSSSGALLELRVSLGTWRHSAEDLPDEFVLIINSENLAFDCHVARRVGQTIGVRFTGPARRIQRSRTQSATKTDASARNSKAATKKSPITQRPGATFGRRG